MSLEFRDCVYAYKPWSTPVVKGVNHRLGAGITVLLGPNGAGKSTLLRLGASAVRPDSGTVTLGRLVAGTRAYRQAVGWMPQHITAVPGLTAREQVAYSGWLKGMGRREAWDAAQSALARVDLSDRGDVKVRRLSGGQLRRVGVASALVHEARVLLLDEPTAGMDPHQRRVFRDVVRSLSSEVRVLLSTHDVADLAEEAESVAVMDAGAIIYAGSTAGFLSHAPAGTAPGRQAEAAYAHLSRSGDHL